GALVVAERRGKQRLQRGGRQGLGLLARLQLVRRLLQLRQVDGAAAGNGDGAAHGDRSRSVARAADEGRRQRRDDGGDQQAEHEGGGQCDERGGKRLVLADLQQPR